jgi:multiple sugar transport system substrate-binding protein
VFAKKRAIALAAVLAAGVASLTGCSGSTQASAGPVTINYWDWTPGMEKVVDVWNKDHPDIQVKFTKVVGADAPTKFLTAIKAGSGAPDIMQTEIQSVASFVANDALADISKYVGPDLKSQFPEALWNQVTLKSGALYTVPQNTGLMVFYYRTDVFKKYGLAVPKTWQEYADTARKLHAADPTAYLGNFSAPDAGWFTGLAQQAGGSWWSTNGGSWTSQIDDSATKKVANFWGGLVQEGVIDNKPNFTPEWNSRMASGALAGWVGAAWAPAILTGSAPDAAGKWAVAPLPQWDTASPATGTWGGAGLGVSSQSKHPEQAAKFVEWVNASKAGLTELIKDTGGLFPSSTTYAGDVLTAPPAYFSNQPDFWKVISGQVSTLQNFTYGPNTNVAYSAYSDAFGKAAEAKQASAFVSAGVQKTTQNDLEQSGFSKK